MGRGRHRWDHPGDCARWDQSITDPLYAQDTKIVPCSRPHFIEMTGHLDIGDRFTEFPQESDWNTIIHLTGCKAKAETYLGAAFDPYGRFEASAITPTLEAWDHGYTTVWCGIVSTSPGASTNGLTEFSGSVKGQDQTLLYDPGTC